MGQKIESIIRIKVDCNGWPAVNAERNNTTKKIILDIGAWFQFNTALLTVSEHTIRGLTIRSMASQAGDVADGSVVFRVLAEAFRFT